MTKKLNCDQNNRRIQRTFKNFKIVDKISENCYCKKKAKKKNKHLQSIKQNLMKN